jgi:hypothetical protein
MHRTIAYIATALLLGAIALVSFPIWAYGAEQFDPEQELGILLVPFALVAFLVAATTPDPRQTTVGGAFGNPEYDRRPPSTGARVDARPRPVSNFRDAVQCAHCGTLISPDLAQCLRCARARPCRTCSRPLGLVLERPTCPPCARAEPLCNCPVLPRPASPVPRTRVFKGSR